MDTNPAKPAPWYADENQEPGPTPGSTDPKGQDRTGEVEAPLAAGTDEDQPVVEPGPKSDRSGKVIKG